MSELNIKIQEYLEKENPDYYEGVELYAEHPKARINIITSLNQQYNKKYMHEKLIYELETCIEMQAHSGKCAILNGRPGNLPLKIVEEIKEAAPEKYDYKVKFENLPEELKALVIEKGQLYNGLDKNKQELAKIGPGNDDKSIAKRAVFIKTMRNQVEKIKKIHALLVKYDESGQFDDGEITALDKIPAGGHKVPVQENDIDKLLQEEFGYQEMGYYERKDLLKKLRSSVPKQEQRALESDKADIKAKNEQKAKLGRGMIEILEKYFEETKEPEK